MEVSFTHLTILIISAVIGVGSFNIDTTQPRILQGNHASFGQSIVQFNSGTNKWVVISAPLQPDQSGQVGKLYRCSYESARCNSIRIPVLPESKMSSFGLTLAATSQLLVSCGTVPKQCQSFTYSKGLCYSIDQDFKSTNLTKEPECPKGADIVFLIDGSRSVIAADFLKMQKFVKEMIGQFDGHDVLFALMQYSSDFTVHFDFNAFNRSRNAEALMKDIKQMRMWTRTPSAIKAVVQDLFIPQSGSRPGATKILIVITDGKTAGDNMNLPEAVAMAQKKGIVRYAIGVGNAFSDSQPEAKQELDTIASSPPEQHVFRPDNFDALENIKNTLQQKIFSIEGTQSTNINAFQFEMAQTGSSTVITEKSILLGAVGAYDWSGGLFVYPRSRQDPSEPKFINASAAESDMRDSYLGYATRVANFERGPLYVSGAPRFQHVGRVMVFTPDGRTVQTIQGNEVGSYFGAELCTLSLKGNGITDLLLIAAPMNQSAQAGGIVHVYQRGQRKVPFVPLKTLQGILGHTFDGFGSTMAALGDINGDGYGDVAVGAPQENGQEGSVYIFHGEDSGIKAQYSQRIIGSQISPGAKFFGRSISGGMDLSNDNLADVAVGSQGQTFILRSQPVIRVTPSITFTPPQIPLSKFECTGAATVGGVVSSARVCFRAISVTRDTFGSLQSTVAFGLRLDAALRVKPRAVFQSGQHTESGTVDVSNSGKDICQTYQVKLPACVEDSLTPIGLTLNFTVVGKEIAGAGSFRPVQDRDALTQLTKELPFEKNCGKDNRCDDKLKVSFNFSGISVLAVGLYPSIDLTVSIQNDGEDSYRTLVNFFFPSGLSYRKVTTLDPNRNTLISCDGGGASKGETSRNSSCRVHHPIFKRGSKAVFITTFDVLEDFSWGPKLVLRINATSDNGDQQNSESKFAAELPIKYGVDVLLKRMDEESVRYINFTRKSEEEKKLVRHVYKVENAARRSLDLQVTFLIPVSIGPSLIWAASGVTPRTGGTQWCKEIAITPASADITGVLSKGEILDCAVAACRKVQCEVHDLQKDEAREFIIEGNVGNEWIPQGQRKLSLVSAAEITFDQSMYIVNQLTNSFLQAKMETVIEVYEEYNYLPVIIGSSLGGLVLLGLISAGLYKAGFFSRRYKRMMEDSSDTQNPATEST